MVKVTCLPVGRKVKGYLPAGRQESYLFVVPPTEGRFTYRRKVHLPKEGSPTEGRFTYRRKVHLPKEGSPTEGR